MKEVKKLKEREWRVKGCFGGLEVWIELLESRTGISSLSLSIDCERGDIRLGRVMQRWPY